MNRTERSARVKRTSTEYFFFPYHTIPLTVCSAGAASPPRQSSSARTASEPAVSSARIAAPAAHAAASVRTLRKWHREAGSRPPAQHAALHPASPRPAHPVAPAPASHRPARPVQPAPASHRPASAAPDHVMVGLAESTLQSRERGAVAREALAPACVTTPCLARPDPGPAAAPIPEPLSDPGGDGRPPRVRCASYPVGRPSQGNRRLRSETYLMHGMLPGPRTLLRRLQSAKGTA